jgi:O-antigen ligase
MANSKRWAATNKTASLSKPSTVLCWLVILTLTCAMVLGGAPAKPGIGFLATSLVSIITLSFALAGGALNNVRALPRACKILLVVLLALPVIQLFPLNMDIYSMLPGHQKAAKTISLVGGAGWLPLSLAPMDTAFAALLFIPPISIFIGILALSQNDRDAVLMAAIGITIISILIGLIQFTSGGTALNFYDSAHKTYLLGFFNNRNHTGLILAVVFVLCAQLVLRKAERRPAFLILGILGILFVAAEIGTASRSGMVFMGAAIISIFVLNNEQPRLRKTLVILGAAAAVLALSLYLADGVFQRSTDRFSEIGEDGRWTIWERSLPLVQLYFPTGSGLGTFATIFAANEKLDWLSPRFVNHAHNDYLEFVIEAGILGVISIILFLYCFLAKAKDVFNRTHWSMNGSERLVVVAVALVITHEFWDYPLRTLAGSCVFALALGMLFGQGKRASLGNGGLLKQGHPE